MLTFTSRRERKLWTWVIVLILTIYASLGVAPAFAAELRERGLLDGIFFTSFVLIGVAAVVQGWRSGAGGLEAGIMLGAGAVFLMMFFRIGLPEERTHLMEYGVVALLIFEALRERWGSHRLLRPAAFAIMVGTLVGSVDELIQALIPSRVFDPEDIVFNGGASAIAVIAAASVSAARGRRISQ